MAFLLNVSIRLTFTPFLYVANLGVMVVGGALGM